MIDIAINRALGDMAEYLNYLNDRLEAAEDKLELDPPDYASELAARYDFPIRKKGEDKK